MERDQFLAAMRRFPSGVAVVTSMRQGIPRGMTLSAFASVTADPPTVLICVNRDARSYLNIADSGTFCVNLLAHDQRDLAVRFSGKVRDNQFDDVAFHFGTTGLPILDGTVAHFECKVVHEHHEGSHSIFAGRVLSAVAQPHAPLGYFDGDFRDFSMEPR